MSPSRQSQGHCSRRSFGTKPAHESAPVKMGFRDVPPGLPSPMSLSAPDAWCFRPFHIFGAEDHPSTPSAPKVNAIRDRRGGGLFLRNNAHITRAASALSLNHHCILHQTTRSRTWTEANHLAERGMTLLKTIFPNNTHAPGSRKTPWKERGRRNWVLGHGGRWFRPKSGKLAARVAGERAGK
jgi:hypothetical protein